MNKEQLQREIRNLKNIKSRMEKAAFNAETYYANIISNTAVMLTHLNRLEKTAGQFNKTVQMMNVGYFIQAIRNTTEQVIDVKDPSNIKIRHVWTREELDAFDKNMYDLADRVYKSIINE